MELCHRFVDEYVNENHLLQFLFFYQILSISRNHAVRNPHTFGWHGNRTTFGVNESNYTEISWRRPHKEKYFVSRYKGSL